MTTASAKRQFVDVAADYVMPYVEVARATSLASVVCVLCKTAGAAGGEVLLRLINRFRVGVGYPEGQSLAEPLLNRQLSAVIV